MKRFMILVLVALITGAAFADTDPAFSGSFSTYFGFSFPDEMVETDVSNGMSLDLNATIDEWNTVSVKVGLADAMYYDDTEVFDGTDINRGSYLRLNSFTLTSDIFGALGVDGPVGLSLKLGDFGFGGSSSVVSVAPLSTGTADGTGGTGSSVGLGFEFKIIDMVTLGTVIYPANLGDIGEDPDKVFEGGVTLKATGIADMVDFAAYFVSSELDLSLDEQGDAQDEDGQSVGASLALTLGSSKVGVGFQYDIDDDIDENEQMALQVDYALTLDKITAGVSYGIGGIKKISENSKVKISVVGNLLDNLSLFGALGVSDFSDISADSIDYDVGLTTALGALAIQLGVTNNMDFKAPEDDWADTLYLKFSTSF